MPELPEVETVKRGLQPVLLNQNIEKIDIHHRGLRFPIPDGFEAALKGQHIKHLERRAKYLLIHLDSDQTLIIHLGMSGHMRIEGKTPKLLKHDHVVFHLSNGQAAIYHDPRRFGFMDLAETKTLADHRFFTHLGPEPFEMTGKDLKKALQNKTGNIKTALLDQRIIAGLGNIYVNEALFQAGISPKRMAGRISLKRLTRLMEAIQGTLERAIAAGGSSLKDHKQTDGKPGYFQHQFKVYGKTRIRCSRTDCTGNIRKEMQNGRASYFCLTCQK